MSNQTLLEEVNTPNHYRGHESGIETISITRYLPNDLGNAWKYGMRYEDKNTPKKDLLKLCWYMNDYRTHFIDDNNEVTENFHVPSKVLTLMECVIEAEPNEVIKDFFKQVYQLCLEQGVLNPCKFNQCLKGVELLAENFSV